MREERSQGCSECVASVSMNGCLKGNECSMHGRMLSLV